MNDDSLTLERAVAQFVISFGSEHIGSAARDGTTEQLFKEHATGSPARPFTAEQFKEKLNDLTEKVIGTEPAGKLFGLVDRLEPGTPIRDVTALLQKR
jgi:hypothetical protein